MLIVTEMVTEMVLEPFIGSVVGEGEIIATMLSIAAGAGLRTAVSVYHQDGAGGEMPRQIKHWLRLELERLNLTVTVPNGRLSKRRNLFNHRLNPSLEPMRQVASAVMQYTFSSSRTFQENGMIKLERKRVLDSMGMDPHKRPKTIPDLQACITRVEEHLELLQGLLAEREAYTTECPVCFEVKSANELVVLPCDHELCTICKARMHENNYDQPRVCPQCRCSMAPPGPYAPLLDI